MSALGAHFILEMYDCPADRLDDLQCVLAAMQAAATAAGSTLLAQSHHRFEPHGVTALALLAESHISVHTWPELGYAAADVFTCGEHTRPARACEILRDMLGAGRSEVRCLERGELPPVRPGRVPAVANG